jgi:hypothetical protein
VNRVDRGLLLLAAAGILLLLTLGAHLIGDVEASSRPREAALRSQGALRAQVEELVEDGRMLQAQTEQAGKDRAELHRQQDTIIRSLQRIEKALEAMAAHGGPH